MLRAAEAPHCPPCRNSLVYLCQGAGKPSPISLLVRYVRQTSDERSPSKCRAIRGSGASTDSIIVGEKADRRHAHSVWPVQVRHLLFNF
jgi:hypothetical protein